jgi:2-methylcitrate dehydratase
MTTTVTKMAEWAAQLHFEQLPPEVVHQAKRVLLDSLGCALGGYFQHDVRIAREVLREVAGRGPASVLGTGQRIDAVSAAFINALMLRCLDYNDVYWRQDPSHPSTILPAALACAERAGRSGRDLVVGLVLGHEFEMRLCEAAVPGIFVRGWHPATLTAFVAPLVAGRMLGLDTQQLAHAVGVSASCHGTLKVVLTGEVTMMKNTADPLAVQRGVLAAFLAEKGFTGPEHVLDGSAGLVQALGPAWQLDAVTDGLGRSWRITQSAIKIFPSQALTQTPISALLDLVKEHDLRPDDVAKVTVRTLAHAVDLLAGPSQYAPRTKETADHSLPYVMAVALVDRQVTPRQFTEAKLADATIRAQLEKVEVVAAPEFESDFPHQQRVVVNVRMTDGREFTKHLDYPRGDPHNALTDQEVEEKFDALAAPVMGLGARRRLREAVWGLECLGTVRELMTLVRVRRTTPQ